MVRMSGTTSSAAAHGTTGMRSEAAPPCDPGLFVRIAHRLLTSAPDKGSAIMPIGPS